MIALSCGIKISAVRHLVLSQSTRVTDRRTDRQISDRQNYDSQDRPRICSRGKNELICKAHKIIKDEITIQAAENTTFP